MKKTLLVGALLYWGSLLSQTDSILQVRGYEQVAKEDIACVLKYAKKLAWDETKLFQKWEELVQIEYIESWDDTESVIVDQREDKALLLYTYNDFAKLEKIENWTRNIVGNTYIKEVAEKVCDILQEIAWVKRL